MAILFVLLVWLSQIAVTSSGYVQTCDYHVKASSTGAGLGLFSSRDVEPFEILEKSVGVPIPINSVLWNPLIYYVEGLNGSHALLALGAGMLLNHAPRHAANVRKVMLFSDGQWRFRYPYQFSIDFLHEYSGYVKEDEEFLVDYGEDWFEDRNLHSLDLLSSQTEDSISKAGKMIANNIETDTMILDKKEEEDRQERRWQLATSCGDFWMSIEPEQQMVIARRDIPAGTAAELSRALLLPVTDTLLASGPLEEVLWWYHDVPRALRSRTEHPTSPYTVPDYAVWHGEYALLLSGKAALLSTSQHTCSLDNASTPDENNHGDNGIENTNTENSKTRRTSSATDIPANIELRYRRPASSAAVQGVVECADSMIVEAVAIRDIVAGEVLRVSACLQLPHRRKILQGSSLAQLQQCLSVPSPASVVTSEEL